MKPLYLLISVISFVTLTMASTAEATTIPGPAPTTASPSYTSGDNFRTSCLNSTNTFRRQHNATALTWNTTLATTAAHLTEPCNFKHSGGPNGENIAAGYANVTAAIDGWGNERAKENYGDGKFSEDTGHFTQLVWKATRTVGCARKDCQELGWFLVCEYWPPGNVEGQFKEQVQKQVGNENAADGLLVRSSWKNSRTLAVAILATGFVILME